MSIVGLLFIAIFAAVAALAALWPLGPALAILCAPFVASSVIALFTGFARLRRPRRHGIPVGAYHH